MSVHRIPISADLLHHVGWEPDIENGNERIERLLRGTTWVMRPSPGFRDAEIVTPTDANGNNVRQVDLKVLHAAYNPWAHDLNVLVTVEAESEPYQNFRRHFWACGEPEPAVIAELGIQVV